MDMSFETLISNEMEIENEDLSGTGLFESFTAAESLEVCRLLGLNGADGDVDNMMRPESSSSGKKRTSAAAATPRRVMAERKRREQLSERFISLASLIPGLKKMDKASILEDAMKHMEELNEKIKSLELEMECYLKKKESDHRVIEQETTTITTTTHEQQQQQQHMEMMVKELSSNKNILIRIYYYKAHGKCDIINIIVSKLLSYLQTIQLTVLNTCFLPFGQHAFDISILAKKMENYNHDIFMQELEQKLGEIIQALV